MRVQQRGEVKPDGGGADAAGAGKAAELGLELHGLSQDAGERE